MRRFLMAAGRQLVPGLSWCHLSQQDMKKLLMVTGDSGETQFHRGLRGRCVSKGQT